MSTESISREEVQKYLIYSVIAIVITTIMFLVGFYYPFLDGTGIFIMITSLTFMTVAIVSLIFYFVNHEIMYGMLASRRKSKTTNNRNVLIGRRILLVIMITGLFIGITAYVIIINNLFS